MDILGIVCSIRIRFAIWQGGAMFRKLFTLFSREGVDWDVGLQSADRVLTSGAIVKDIDSTLGFFMSATGHLMWNGEKRDVHSLTPAQLAALLLAVPDEDFKVFTPSRRGGTWDNRWLCVQLPDSSLLLISWRGDLDPGGVWRPRLLPEE